MISTLLETFITFRGSAAKRPIIVSFCDVFVYIVVVEDV